MTGGFSPPSPLSPSTDVVQGEAQPSIPPPLFLPRSSLPLVQLVHLSFPSCFIFLSVCCLSVPNPFISSSFLCLPCFPFAGLISFPETVHHRGRRGHDPNLQFTPMVFVTGSFERFTFHFNWQLVEAKLSNNALSFIRI